MLADEDDDDAAFEEWLQLSEAQQDAMLENNMREYQQALDQLTPIQHYRLRRSNLLQACCRWRSLAQQHKLAFFSSRLQHCQKMLLRLRLWRTSNYTIYPSSDD